MDERHNCDGCQETDQTWPFALIGEVYVGKRHCFGYYLPHGLWLCERCQEEAGGFVKLQEIETKRVDW